MSPAPHVDIALVGFGPVGAGAAVLLGHAGLRLAAFERASAIYDLPRAVGLDGEIVRAFQRIGLGCEVEEVTQPYREGDAVWFTDSKRRAVLGTELLPHGLNGWRDIAFFDQPELEAVLRELASRYPNVTLHSGHEVIDVEEHERGVTLGVRDLATGADRGVTARYVIGCDGASSFVRKRLDIGWQSLGYDQDWLVVDIVQTPEARLPTCTMQVCDPARLTTYVHTKDPYRRWEFRLLPGESREEMAQPERVRELLAPWLPPEHYALRRAVVYQFHAATAERWRAGNVFLAGDAAHQTPPFLGQGMNAGLRDVINLAWKLPLVLDGTAEPSLLDTYAAERDAHARDLVEWAVAIGQLMESLAAAEASGQAQRPAAEHVSSGYGQGRTAPPLRGGVIVEEQVADGNATGHLFRQPRVRTAEGNEVMLDELLGPGFAVVGRADADLAMSDASQRTIARLGGRMVSLANVEARLGSVDALFERHGAAIVRPDRYVFGVTDERLSVDDLVRRLSTSLRLAP